MRDLPQAKSKGLSPVSTQFLLSHESDIERERGDQNDEDDGDAGDTGDEEDKKRKGERERDDKKDTVGESN